MMLKVGMLEVLVRSGIGLYAGEKTSVRVVSEWSQEFKVKAGMHIE